MTTFVVIMLPVLLALGRWQLDRAAEKRAYLDAFIDRQGALPVLADTEAADFQRLRLTGHFEPEHQFLLDNQVSGGHVGYWVVTPFTTSDGRRWLINRGWAPAPTHRETLPDVPAPTGTVSIVAVNWPDMGLPPLLGEDFWAPGWPKRVQRLDVARMAAVLGDDTRPMQLRLEAGQPGVLVAPPLQLPVTPAKHTGYAVQWFALAVVLAAGYLAYGFGFRWQRSRPR
jgi:cytochrome oxidase assembly protein ShyY1